MSVVFLILIVSLLVVGTYLSGLQRATLYWGREIAGLGGLRRDIDDAKASDPVKAAEILGRSVHQAGFQDAITPPWHTNATFLYWALCLAGFIGGFFILPWYIAVAWPVIFALVKRLAGSLFPSASSDFCRQKLLASLDSRCEQFRCAGDHKRLAALLSVPLELNLSIIRFNRAEFLRLGPPLALP